MNSSHCGNCLNVEKKARFRDFNPQIWSLLVSWQEVDKSVVGQPLCETCYRDLREMLIDRSVEMEVALTTGILPPPSKKKMHQPAVAQKAAPVAAAATKTQAVSKTQTVSKSKPASKPQPVASKKKAAAAPQKKKKPMRKAG